MNKRKIIIVAAVLGIIFGSYGLMKLMASMKPAPPAPQIEQHSRFVIAKPVKYSSVKSEILSQGRINTSQEIELVAEASGKIERGNIIIKKGTTFKKGDILFQIYKDELQLSLYSQKSRFLNSVAGILPDLKIDFPSHHKLYLDFFNNIDIKNNLPELPKTELSNLKVFLASRNIIAEYYSIKQQELALTRTTVYAPFDGTIVHTYLETGAYANIGTKVAKIINTQELELEVSINNSDSKWITIGDNVKITSSQREKSWSGKVKRIADFVDINTQSRAVFIAIDNNKNDVLSGEFMIASFSTVDIKNVMEIPRNSVFNQNEVFVIENGKLKKALINVVKINTNTLLFNGLKENTIIVAESLIGAKEGDLVKPLE